MFVARTTEFFLFGHAADPDATGSHHCTGRIWLSDAGAISVSIPASFGVGPLSHVKINYVVHASCEFPPRVFHCVDVASPLVPRFTCVFLQPLCSPSFCSEISVRMPNYSHLHRLAELADPDHLIHHPISWEVCAHFQERYTEVRSKY